MRWASTFAEAFMATSPAIAAAQQELSDKLAQYGPELEGLLDFERLNIRDATRVEVRKAITDYQRRVSLIRQALDALNRVMDDGHPELDVREILQDAYRDLQENAATIEAALKRFAPLTASDLGLTGSTPEAK